MPDPSPQLSMLQTKKCLKFSSFLVGGFNPSEKYESQLGWFIPNICKNVQKSNMFQTTNQFLLLQHLKTWYFRWNPAVIFDSLWYPLLLHKNGKYMCTINPAVGPVSEASLASYQVYHPHPHVSLGYRDWLLPPNGTASNTAHLYTPQTCVENKDLWYPWYLYVTPEGFVGKTYNLSQHKNPILVNFGW